MAGSKAKVRGNRRAGLVKVIAQDASERCGEGEAETGQIDYAKPSLAQQGRASSARLYLTCRAAITVDTGSHLGTACMV